MSENRRRDPQSVGLTMKEIAELVGGRLEGDGGLWVSGIGPVDEADAGQMAFLARKRYARYAPGSRASSFLVSSGFILLNHIAFVFIQLLLLVWA